MSKNKCKHKFELTEPYEKSELIGSRIRTIRVEREQCSRCFGYWKNPIHVNAVMEDRDIDGYWGTTYEEEHTDPQLYDDPLPQRKPEVINE